MNVPHRPQKYTWSISKVWVQKYFDRLCKIKTVGLGEMCSRFQERVRFCSTSRPKIDFETMREDSSFEGGQPRQQE
jgi:hypothetical protein